jgi:hypothetical protein
MIQKTGDDYCQRDNEVNAGVQLRGEKEPDAIDGIAETLNPLL